MKVNDLLQSAQENETQRYSLPVTTGTPLSKKQRSGTEKKCCWQGGDATPWRMSPASPQRRHSRVQPSMPMVYLNFWQGAPARRPCGNITQPIAAPYQQTHQAHKTPDEVDPMMPETLPDLTETSLPITSRDALPASQCTRVHGPSPACQAGAVTLQPAEILPLPDVACSNLGGLTLGIVKLSNTNDTRRYTMLAQLILGRLAFQHTLSLKCLEQVGDGVGRALDSSLRNELFFPHLFYHGN